MCLAIPGKIIEINKDQAVIDYGNEKRKANCSLIKCDVGDYVIVSNQMVIDKINKKEAEESLKMYSEAISKS
jgi:hydrogenase expression/formation protein HypC